MLSYVCLQGVLLSIQQDFYPQVSLSKKLSPGSLTGFQARANHLELSGVSYDCKK